MTCSNSEELAARLSTYSEPSDFMDIFAESDNVPSQEFLSNGRWNPIQEAWVAVHLALHLEHTLGHGICLKLASGDFPDFYLKYKEEELPFEITMVVPPGREMGREAKEDAEGQRKFEETGDSQELSYRSYRPAKGSREGPGWIAKGLLKKKNKQYDPPPHLLVYANFDSHGIEPTELKKRCNAFETAFPSIWVLHNKDCLQVFDLPVFGETDSMWHRVPR